MSAETGQPPQPEGYVETIVKDALNWLNVVGRFDHELPKPDTPYNRANGEVLRYLGDRMAEGDFDTARLLATFERQSQQATSGSKHESDVEAQDWERASIFYDFARTMNRYAGRVYGN